MISIRGLRKVYSQGTRSVTALDSIDLHVPRGSIHGIIGPSGSGKSTLVRCLTLLDLPTEGSIEVNGQVLTDASSSQLRLVRRRIGMIFQHGNLMSSRTVLDNVTLPLEVSGVSKSLARGKAKELLDLVGLSELVNSYPAQLSGGQRQRVGIARALASDPDVLVADEPTAALDPDTTEDILHLIRSVAERLNLTVIVITHEMAVVKALCDSVSLLEAGRIVETGPLAGIAANPHSPLATKLMPYSGASNIQAQGSVIAVLGTGATAHRPVTTLLSDAGMNSTVLSANTETLGGTSVVRWLLDIDGNPDQAREVLSTHGFTTDTVDLKEAI